MNTLQLPAAKVLISHLPRYGLWLGNGHLQRLIAQNISMVVVLVLVTMAHIQAPLELGAVKD